MRMLVGLGVAAFMGASAGAADSNASRKVVWKHLSSAAGDVEAPNGGTQQTSSVVADFDKDRVNDFAITERTRAPSVLWYRRTSRGWTRHVVDGEQLKIEAGSDACDIDGDGDLDLMAGGDSGSNQVWWWENPCPAFDPARPWKRRLIKNGGGAKHHDQMFGDFDGDARPELVFWNQGAGKLFLAEIPDNVREAPAWPSTEIFSFSADGEMQQRGTYPGFKQINEHEGLAGADIDGDGITDIVGGGRWFKHRGGGAFETHIIDASYTFSRCAAGQLIKGGRPEVVLVVGDGWAPLIMYEWRKGVWVPKEILPSIDCGHSLALLDFDGDGNLDIWVAEMRLYGKNPESRNMILLGDGAGSFAITEVARGVENHESKIADLDGDGDFDILGKPYNLGAPGLDIWINEGRER